MEKPSIILFIAAFIASLACLFFVFDRFFVSGKAVKPMLAAFALSLALCLGFMGLSVEESPGTVVGSRSYYKVYYLNGVKVGRSRLITERDVVGRVTVAGELGLFALLFSVVGTIQALSLVYAKEKVKTKPCNIISKLFLFSLYSALSYFTLGIVGLVYLSDLKALRKSGSLPPP